MKPVRREEELRTTEPAERRAWQEAIAKYNQRVIVALLARRIRLDHAQDLAQEAWTKLIEQQRRGGLERIELPGLVIRQALFLAQDAARAAQVRRRETDEALSATATAEPSAEMRILSREQLARSYKMIDALPRRSREIFELCYHEEELSHAQVAEQLGISVQHVRQTLYEVRTKLRALFREAP